MNDEIETIMPETPFESRAYRIRFMCDQCGHEWKRTFKVPPKKDPPCPNKACATLQLVKQQAAELANLRAMLESQIPPGHIGDNPRVKAVDTTAQIVMEDHKMTNLRDNIRTGDSVAPSLPAHQQRQVDGFFNGAAVAQSRGINQKQMDLLGRRAIAGAFRNMAVPPSVVQPAGTPKGQSPLRLARTESLKGNR